LLLLQQTPIEKCLAFLLSDTSPLPLQGISPFKKTPGGRISQPLVVRRAWIPPPACPGQSLAVRPRIFFKDLLLVQVCIYNSLSASFSSRCEVEQFCVQSTQGLPAIWPVGTLSDRSIEDAHLWLYVWFYVQIFCSDIRNLGALQSLLDGSLNEFYLSLPCYCR
jgi:hypothetical protein